MYIWLIKCTKSNFNLVLFLYQMGIMRLKNDYNNHNGHNDIKQKIITIKLLLSGK